MNTGDWQVIDRWERWEDRPSALCSSMAKYSLASTSSLSLSSSSSHRVVMEMEPCCSDDTVVTRSCCVRFVSYSCCVVSSIMSRRRETDPCRRLLASVKTKERILTHHGILCFFFSNVYMDRVIFNLKINTGYSTSWDWKWNSFHEGDRIFEFLFITISLIFGYISFKS